MKVGGNAISVVKSPGEVVRRVLDKLLPAQRIGHYFLFATGIFVALSAIEDFQILVRCAWPSKATLGMGPGIEIFHLCKENFSFDASTGFIAAVATGISVALGAFLVLLGMMEEKLPRATIVLRILCVLFAIVGGTIVIASFWSILQENGAVFAFPIGFGGWAAIVVLLPVFTDFGSRLERKPTRLRAGAYLSISMIAASIAGMHKFEFGPFMFGICCVLLAVFASVRWRRYRNFELMLRQQASNRVLKETLG